MNAIKWHRSEDEHVDSHCGHFSISPEYYGTTRAQSYKVRYNFEPGKLANTTVIASGCDTQAAAKLEAADYNPPIFWRGESNEV